MDENLARAVTEGNDSLLVCLPLVQKKDLPAFRRLFVVKPMPTVYRYKGFRLHFYSDEGHEPPHIHVRRGDDTCKFWLRPVRLA